MRLLHNNWVNFLSLSHYLMWEADYSVVNSQMLRVERNPLSKVNCKHQWDSICYRWFLFLFRDHRCFHSELHWTQNVDYKWCESFLFDTMEYREFTSDDCVHRVSRSWSAFWSNTKIKWFLLLIFIILSVHKQLCTTYSTVPSCNYQAYSIAAFAFWLPCAVRM